MYDYIVDSFAGVLTKGDVVALFNELIDHYKGNKSKAVREIGVTPATTYGWEDANYIKHDTKKKVLKAILEHRHLVAFKYLLDRTSDKQTDILRTLLIDLYSEAIVEEDPEKFRDAYGKYEEIRTHFRGTIRDHIEEEVSEMNTHLEEQAEELGVAIRAPSINELMAKDLLDTLPLIVMEYRNNRSNPVKAAENLKLPVGSIHTFWSTFSSMRSPRPFAGMSHSRVSFGIMTAILNAQIRCRPLEPEYQPRKGMITPLGTLLVTRPSAMHGVSSKWYPEDASTYCDFQPALPAEIAVGYST